MTTTGVDRGKREASSTGSAVGQSTRLRQQLIKAARWLHLYLSMVSFAVIFFFAATGLTLNHPEWFSKAVRTSERHGAVDPSLLKALGGSVNLPGLLQAVQIREHLHGTTDEPRVDDSQVGFSFGAPGYTADVTVDRPAGTYIVTETRNGFVAVLNDLHRGHDAGKAWSWLIDLSAALLTLVSLTGFVILWFIYKRRASGLAIAVAGLALVLLVYRIFVP